MPSLTCDSEAVEKFHTQRLDRAAFVSNLISTEASLFQNSHFIQENPLRKKSNHDAASYAEPHLSVAPFSLDLH